jgi:bifunctional DNase/RNase
MIKMTVRGIALDPLTNMPIIILKDQDDKRALPIWVGIFEANAIALELEKISTPRPMTHDLIKNILDGLGANVQQIVVNDLKDNTFFAVIEISVNGNLVNIDSRPSDAIALALRVNAPIFVTENVVTKAKSIEVSEEKEESDRWREWLENLKPEDFGKYKM